MVRSEDMKDAHRSTVSKYQAPALEKGLDILEYLSSRPEPATQTEIAEAIGRKPNAIFRMLMCLEERGYVRRDSTFSGYELTLKLYSLSHGPSPLESLRDVAKPIMRELSAHTNQASHLTVFYQDDLMIVAPTVSPGPISVVMSEGKTYPLLAATSGRVLLAQCSPEERAGRLERLDAYRRLTDGEARELHGEIEKIGTTGFFVRKSRLTQGITDIAVGIGNAHTPLKAVLSLVCLSSDLNNHMTLDQMIQAVRESAATIARKLGNPERPYGNPVL